MECCLRKLFLPQSFFKRWPLKETFESFLKETFSMKFYGRHSEHTYCCGYGCGGGAMMGVGGWWGGGEGGWGEAFIEVLNTTGIVTRLGCHNERYDTKSYTKSRGILDFGGIPL